MHDKNTISFAASENFESRYCDELEVISEYLPQKPDKKPYNQQVQAILEENIKDREIDEI
jgi:hypothetical protein